MRFRQCFKLDAQLADERSHSRESGEGGHCCGDCPAPEDEQGRCTYFEGLDLFFILLYFHLRNETFGISIYFCNSNNKTPMHRADSSSCSHR